MSRVLVAHGSVRGGTAQIAEWIADELRTCGHEVDVRPAGGRGAVSGYEAVVLGGALYMNRWHRGARRMARLHRRALSRVPLWLFSSGPLESVPRDGEPAPVRAVARTATRLGAVGQAVFGGRLAPDARGPIAARMAKTMAGDWRDEPAVRAWARDISQALAEPAGTSVLHRSDV